MKVVYDEYSRPIELHLEEGETPEVEIAFIHDYFDSIKKHEEELTVRHKNFIDGNVKSQQFYLSFNGGTI